MLSGAQEDSKVAKKMVMYFHLIEGWRFDNFSSPCSGLVPRWPAWVYEAIVCMQLNMGPCMGIALGSDRWWAVIRGINNCAIILSLQALNTST